MTTIIAEVREKLAYRTPNNNKPLGHIVLTRAQAEQLVQEYEAAISPIERAGRE